ncbi:PI-PLC X domain-containing protein At5g67130-like [Lolium rigidum]|uniref:PI-PLC X domain-containing protein At5g67130-like n=1 Tax=Lolium rigidum TaxID=89674 RepID=UPI001F5D008F|nr:PI-PLC X domain-containing protein At5g67130-like [Lolium rigidum]
MAGTRRRGVMLLLIAIAFFAARPGPSSASALVGDRCAANSPPSSCGAGMRCATCSPLPGSGPAVCSRTTPIDPKTHGTGLPFNKYSWLTTHNSFAVAGTPSATGAPIVSPPNQGDSVTSQLNNGVRGLMLDTYDFKNDLWLCHSFAGKCYDFTAYVPASKVLKEIQAFLDSNPNEVITVFIEDYSAPGSLAKALAAAGLTKYVFPPAKMPANGADWPTLKDMVAQGHRLLVFTSKQGRESSDGAAYEWNYVVETKYGSDGLAVGTCGNRGESKPMDSKAQSLLLLNFFTTNPSQSWACVNNSAPLIDKLKSCYDAFGKRWPNFIAVDFYMRSSGGGAPLATDVANGRLQCGCDSIAYCKANAPFGTCTMSSSSPPSLSPSPSSSPAPGSGSSSSSPSLAPVSRTAPPPSSTTSPLSSPSWSWSPAPAPARTRSRPRSWASSATMSLFSLLPSAWELSPPMSSSMSPSLAPSSWSYGTSAPSPSLAPSWWSYGAAALSPSSSSPSSSPQSSTSINTMSVQEEGIAQTQEPSPKSTTDQGTAQAPSPESTSAATGVPQRTLPKSIAEAPTPEAEDSTGAAIRPGTPRLSSLFGTAALVLISLC